jgi:hypothetical protein
MRVIKELALAEPLVDSVNPDQARRRCVLGGESLRVVQLSACRVI